MEGLLVDIVAPENSCDDEVKLKNEEDAEPHKCATCSCSFSAKRDLVTHQYMHRENQKLSCPECSKVFMTESGLSKHLRSGAHNKKKPEKKQKVAAPKRRKNHTCRQCNAVFDTKKQLSLHHTAKHVDEKRFVCEICSSQFAWPENLRAHKQSHEVNPHECKKCGRRFVDATSLRVHTRNSHGPNSLKTEPRKTFSCGICGRAFQFDFSLRAHMKGHAQAPGNSQQHQVQDVEQPRYVQMNQEGIIDLRSQNENDANEIIIEVYNYDTMQTGHGHEDQHSIQQHHNLALKDEEHKKTEKNQDWFVNCSQHDLEPKDEDIGTHTNLAAHGTSVTSALNPVSIDESGMCITVSAEALPSLLGMDMNNSLSAQCDSSVVEEPKEVEAQSNVCYTRNAELIWYEPPTQTTDDQNAMIVWYQQPQPESGEGSYAWNQEEDQRSNGSAKQEISAADAEDVMYAKEQNEAVMQTVSQQAPTKHVTDVRDDPSDVQPPPPVPRLRGRKSRPKEPFLFNCVMTDEKPFVCLNCGEAFRWEISLNVHLREHNIGNEDSSTYIATRGKRRGVPRGPARGRAGVRVQMKPLTKNNSAVKSKSPVGKSRIVPRTASSDEEDEYDEYSFHGQPDEDPIPHKAGQTKRLSAERKKINSDGRGRQNGLKVRGFGPRRRGNCSRAEKDLQNNETDNVVSMSTNDQDKYAIVIEPAGGEFSKGTESISKMYLGSKDSSSLDNGIPVLNNKENGVDDTHKVESEMQITQSSVSNALNPPGSPLNLTSEPPNADMENLPKTNTLVNSVIFTASPQSVWWKCWRSNLRKYSFCSLCKQLLTTLSTVRRHRRKHAQLRSRTVGQRKFACKSCSVLCLSRLDVLLHRRCCGSLGVTQCNVCRREFTSKPKLDAHRLNHFSKVKPSRCLVCDKRFFNDVMCKMHQLLHVIL